MFRHLLRSPCHQRQEGGGAMIRAAGPDSLLVIMPAFNEEGAIAGVVRSVNRSMPGVPVLVIDDCSWTTPSPRRAQRGAEVLPLPHHLGWAAACRRATSWPTSWASST